MDIATLGIKVENGQVVQATAALNNMTVAGAKTEAATQRLTRRMALAEIEARKMDAAMGSMHPTVSKLASAFSAFSAIAVVGFIGRETIKNTIEAQHAMAQLEAAVASTGGAAGRTVAQLDALSMQLQRQTTFSDEAVKGAEAMLLTFDKIRGTEFDRATAAITDLATRMGGDLQGAAIQVGKALQDPATGLTALRRSGVSFSESQVALIKSLYDTGQVAEGQRVILKELEHQFGGSAAAARDTLGGALEGLKNTFGDLFEVTKGGSQGTVTAINAIAHALETSGLSMNTFLTNTVIGWNNISATIQKAANWLGVITNPASYAAVKALNDELEKQRIAANAAARAPAKAGPASGGGGGGGGVDAEGLTKAEREAQRIADQQANARNQLAIDEIRKRAKEAEETRRAQERYVNDITDIWKSGVADVVRATDQGFQAILNSIGNLVGSLIERMAREGKSSGLLGGVSAAIGGGLLGYGVGGRSTNRAVGGLSGAAAGAASGFMAAGPIGAAIGGFTGLIGGIFGAGNAAKEAAKQMQALRESLALSIEGMRATIAGDDIGVAIAQVKAQFAQLRQQTEDAYPNRAGEAERGRVLRELDSLEAKRIAQLKEQGKAIHDSAAAMLNLTSSYKVQAAIFGAIDPNGSRGGGVMNPNLRPPTSRTDGNGGDLTVNVVMPNGEVLSNLVLKNFKQKASAQYGDTTRWSEVH